MTGPEPQPHPHRKPQKGSKEHQYHHGASYYKDDIFSDDSDEDSEDEEEEDYEYYVGRKARTLQKRGPKPETKSLDSSKRSRRQYESSEDEEPYHHR